MCCIIALYHYDHCARVQVHQQRCPYDASSHPFSRAPTILHTSIYTYYVIIIYCPPLVTGRVHGPAAHCTVGTFHWNPRNLLRTTVRRGCVRNNLIMVPREIRAASTYAITNCVVQRNSIMRVYYILLCVMTYPAVFAEIHFAPQTFMCLCTTMFPSICWEHTLYTMSMSLSIKHFS